MTVRAVLFGFPNFTRYGMKITPTFRLNTRVIPRIADVAILYKIKQMEAGRTQRRTSPSTHTEEERRQAYPAEFAAALQDYMVYFRSLITSTIYSTLDIHTSEELCNPRTVIRCIVDGHRSGAPTPAYLRWTWPGHQGSLNTFTAKDFYDGDTLASLGLIHPVDQIKAEMEPMGYMFEPAGDRLLTFSFTV